MNKRDLKKLKIDPSFVITPDKFITMFGIECDKFVKLDIHDLHYVLGNNLNHAGVNQINIDKLYKGEIFLIGTPNNFKVYYRPIKYKIQINNKIEEKTELEENSPTCINLSELCDLCTTAVDIEELNEYLAEIYERINFDSEDELESNRVKIYTAASRARRYY